MPLILDPTERKLLADLADVLIPAGEGLPSASQAGVANEGLDRVLEVRTDLLEPLKNLLAGARNRAPAEVIEDLQRNDPPAFGVLAELVPGAYFLNSEVRSKIKYQGQNPRPIDERQDYLDEGLLQSVLDRGPIYRPTPNAGNAPGYNWRETYDWNYENVPNPVGLTQSPVPGPVGLLRLEGRLAVGNCGRTPPEWKMDLLLRFPRL